MVSNIHSIAPKARGSPEGPCTGRGHVQVSSWHSRAPVPKVACSGFFGPLGELVGGEGEETGLPTQQLPTTGERHSPHKPGGALAVQSGSAGNGKGSARWLCDETLLPVSLPVWVLLHLSPSQRLSACLPVPPFGAVALCVPSLCLLVTIPVGLVPAEGWPPARLSRFLPSGWAHPTLQLALREVDLLRPAGLPVSAPGPLPGQVRWRLTPSAPLSVASAPAQRPGPASHLPTRAHRAAVRGPTEVSALSGAGPSWPPLCFP